MPLERASEVMDEISARPPGTFTDEDVALTCARGEDVTAAEAVVGMDSKGRTVYTCREHHRPLLTITPGPVRAFETHHGMKLTVRPVTGDE